MNTKEWLLTLQEAREALRLGQTKFFALLKAGELETIRVGRRRLVPRQALEEFIQRKRKGEPA